MLASTTQQKLDALKVALTSALAGLVEDIAQLKANAQNGATAEEIDAALDEIMSKANQLTSLDEETN